VDAPDRRLKTAAELFANGRFAGAGALADDLWQEGDRSPELTILSGELALLRNRLEEAETALRAALQALEGHPWLLALLAETLRRADRLAEAAGIYRGLGRTGMANKIGALAARGAYRLARRQSEVRWM
jgi:predicted Zn-dependent protease